MYYNYSKLAVKIINNCGSFAQFITLMGLKKEDFQNILMCKQEWKKEEIEKACQILSIVPEEVNDYFFTEFAKEDVDLFTEWKKAFIDKITHTQKYIEEMFEISKSSLSKLDRIMQLEQQIAQKTSK